ncbi:hypothetical protein PHYC_02019 [Phycisphaerales bacterium]|nr:hypothetical protein PHYC_02019 [Phycisphaerales bacterium]
MKPNHTQLAAVLAAGTNLLAARRADMETLEEWLALARAVAACTDAKAADFLTQRDLERIVEGSPLRRTLAADGPPPGETFRVENGMLVRAVIPANGRPYMHRCTLAVFESVARAIDEAGGKPLSLEALRAATGLPSTQVNVAFAFLKERGCVVPAFKRRHKANGGAVHPLAMAEYHALREGDA